MQDPKDITGNYHKIPNDLYRAVDTPYEYTVLTALFRFSNGSGVISASYNTIASGLMTRRHCIDIMRKFQNLEFVKYETNDANKANKIQLDIDKILAYARHRLDAKELAEKAKKEMSEKQRKAMHIRLGVQHPEWVAEEQRLLGEYESEGEG